MNRWLFMVLALGLAGGCSRGDDPLKAVPHTKAERKDFEQAIVEMGVIAARKTYPILAPFSGKITQITGTGENVKVGDPVLTLQSDSFSDTVSKQLNDLKTAKTEIERSVEDLLIGLRSSVLEVDSSEAGLAFNRVKLANVNEKLAQVEVLEKSSVVAADELRDAQASVTESRLGAVGSDLDYRNQIASQSGDASTKRTDIDRQALTANATKRQLLEAADKLNKATVTAPVAGIFVRDQKWSWQSRRNAERQVGDDVYEGESVGQIPDLTTMIIKTQIPEGKVDTISLGTDVNVRVDALNGFETTGKIVRIGRVAIERERSAGGMLTGSSGSSAFTGQKVFEVDLEIRATEKALKPGMTAEVRIPLSRSSGVVCVPLGAVLRRGDNYVVARFLDGKLVEQPVTLGANNEKEVIVESGLSGGEDLAATDPLLVLPQGARL